MKFLNKIDGANQLQTDASNRLVTDAEKANWNLASTQKHTHANKTTLDKFSESAGKPIYNGEAIGGISQIISVEGMTTLAAASNSAAINIAGFNKTRDTLIVFVNSVHSDDYTINANNLVINKKSGIWDAGTIFNFVALQVASLPQNTDLLESLMIIRRQEFTATAGQTTFILSLGQYIPNGNRLSIFLWGSKQPNSAFFETNSTSFTMAAPLEAGDRIVAEWIETIDATGFYGGHANTHKPGGGDEVPIMKVSSVKPTNGVAMWYEEVV